MRLFKNLTIISAMFICMLVSSRVNAGILWEKELVPDANTNSTPFASCLNKNGDGIFVMTVECPKGSLPLLGGNCVLWEIGADGSAIRTLLKDGNGAKIRTNTETIYGVIGLDTSNNLLTLGVLSKQKGEKGQKIGVISKGGKISPCNSINSHSIKKMMPLQDNTFILIGQRDSNGLYAQIDKQGGIIQEEIFDMGQGEVFTDIDKPKNDNTSLIIAGISCDLSQPYPKNFILIYDNNKKIISEDYFIGKFPPLLFPKICILDNSNIVAVYTKAGADPNKTLLTARCYTNKLKLLWEKEILSTDEIVTFDIISNNSGFIAAAALNNLELYSFSDNGTKTEHIKYNDNSPGIPGFNLMRVNDKIIVVFEEGITPVDRKWNFKAKVISLD